MQSERVEEHGLGAKFPPNSKTRNYWIKKHVLLWNINTTWNGHLYEDVCKWCQISFLYQRKLSYMLLSRNTKSQSNRKKSHNDTRNPTIRKSSPRWRYPRSCTCSCACRRACLGTCLRTWTTWIGHGRHTSRYRLLAQRRRREHQGTWSRYKDRSSRRIRLSCNFTGECINTSRRWNPYLISGLVV